ncbi:VOC family protein [Salinivibrio costicola]|jgi:Glyoxalase/Bleomycin resistance protein/Dioxygenase superfamily.|uniref:VOC family protein n=1 Tax=Salinivibrio costicola TaxID=51367 RepID=UPI003F6F16C0
MIDKDTVMRVARPTDNLADITNMYCEGLGFELLGTFSGHNDFDGAIIGHPHHNYHLEFTHHRGTHVGPAPSQENLLVFYLPDHAAWQAACQQIEAAGFKPVPSYNSYWDKDGCTFEDLDGYRVVLQNREWAW